MDRSRRRHILEKVAVNLEQLRVAGNAMKGLVSRRAPVPSGIGGALERLTGESEKGFFAGMVGEGRRARLYITGSPQKIRSFREMLNVPNASPAEREALNRSIWLHEGNELSTKQPGALTMSGHRSWRPPLVDLNVAATATPEIARAGDAIRNMRADEIANIRRVVPGLRDLNLGHERLSRHAIKRVQQAYDTGMVRGQLARRVRVLRPAAEYEADAARYRGNIDAEIARAGSRRPPGREYVEYALREAHLADDSAVVARTGLAGAPHAIQQRWFGDARQELASLTRSPRHMPAFSARALPR